MTSKEQRAKPTHVVFSLYSGNDRDLGVKENIVFIFLFLN